MSNTAELKSVLEDSLKNTPILDIHTHLFPPSFGDLCLVGIDELLNYHYLVSELFRHIESDYGRFWGLSRERRADLVWEKLFLERSPVSEASKGVLTVLQTMDLPIARDLDVIRKAFAARDREEYVAQLMERSGVDRLVMTNDPFDPCQQSTLEKGPTEDRRFLYVLRLDALLLHWDAASVYLAGEGYDVSESILSRSVQREVNRFLADWIVRFDPLYLAASLPETFAYPDGSVPSILLNECLLPACQEHDLPLGLMIGVQKRVNPGLKEGGDAVGRADLSALRNLCTQWPDVKFLATLLSRENQYELAVLAKKFPNLMPFGCWWWLNTPFLVEEITRMRFDLLGTGFIPQHSDCRVFDQLIYKWKHSLKVLEKIMIENYGQLIAAGWPVTETDVRRDVYALLRGNFLDFTDNTEDIL